MFLFMQLIKDFYNVTYTNRTGEIDDYMLTFLWSLTTAIYLPGGMIGAFSAGYLADRIGRCVSQGPIQNLDLRGGAIMEAPKPPYGGAVAGAISPKFWAVGKFFGTVFVQKLIICR